MENEIITITIQATTSSGAFTFDCTQGYWIPIFSWFFGFVGQVCEIVNL